MDGCLLIADLGSEEMTFVQFIIPLEVAHDTIAELGQLGDVQFKDVSLNISEKSAAE